MKFPLFLLFFFTSYQFIRITTALINSNPDNSPRNIDLYQCKTKQTIVKSIISITNDTIFNSCDFNCCITNNSNQTSIFNKILILKPFSSALVDSNTCQLTVKSLADACLGRLCYPGKCDQFQNITYPQNIRNSTTFMNRLRWALWIDDYDLFIRYSTLILILILNLTLTLVTMCVVIKSIRHSKMIAERKSRRYSLFY
jgi:hypothetical protein